ncbi:MAG: Cys-Xaa-Xaa-Xaa repeat radical SAM target protein [Alistipes sp.]|nr:Cys-Xaa-Xaa-Xaa repeat radical SAM target protein [Alistipes sp.]
MKKKNEELQSRRDFFKKAAKAALPILGMALLAANPVIAKAAEAKSATGCGYCQYSCTSCVGGCLDACARSCKACSNGCARGCHANCYTGCNGKVNQYR